MKHWLLLVAFTAGVLALMGGPAGAITVSFFDQTDGPPTATVVGVPFTTTPGSTAESLIVGFQIASPDPAFLVTYGLTEPPLFTDISDTIEINATAAAGVLTFTITFTSDSESSLPRPVLFIGLPETAPQPFFSQTFSTVNPAVTIPLSISAFSDVDVVPEPTTLLFLGAGLAGLGGLRFRRGRAL